MADAEALSAPELHAHAKPAMAEGTGIAAHEAAAEAPPGDDGDATAAAAAAASAEHDARQVRLQRATMRCSVASCKVSVL